MLDVLPCSRLSAAGNNVSISRTMMGCNVPDSNFEGDCAKLSTIQGVTGIRRPFAL